MSRAARRASRAPTRSRRTPSRPHQQGGFSIPWIPITVVVFIVAVAGVVVYLVIQSGKSQADRFSAAAKYEENKQDGSPGEWVDLPTAWADGATLAHYGANSGPNTNSHVTHDVDYSKELTQNSSTGYPPVGGPHWGSSTCTDTPTDAPAFCGPVPWGIYREEWHPESLVHNMEHAGTVIWYNTADTAIRDKIEAEAKKYLKKYSGQGIVVAPYSNMPADTIAITSWARRDVFSTTNLDMKRIDTFIEKFHCAFDPENICG